MVMACWLSLESRWDVLSIMVELTVVLAMVTVVILVVMVVTRIVNCNEDKTTTSWDDFNNKRCQD